MSRIRVGTTVFRVPLFPLAIFIIDGVQEVGIGHVITHLLPVGGSTISQGLGGLLDGLLVANVEP